LRALELNEKFLGPDHTVVAANLSQLGKLYKEEKAFDQAEPMFLRALAISESLSPGGDDLVVAHYVIQIQDFYVSWGKFDKAEPYARRILAMNERVYGPSSRMVLNQLETLIEVVRRQNSIRRRIAPKRGVMESIMRGCYRISPVDGNAVCC
jgi:tetratricopeptide (TPR) repeat protein